MGKRLVLVGGGHAHMVTLANLGSFLKKGHEVTVIGPSAYHYYSGMGPGMLGKFYTPDDIRFATRQVVEKQGGRFVLGKVTRIDPQGKTLFLEDGATVRYDVLSCNAGSYVPQSNVKGSGDAIFPVKPIERLMEAQSRLLDLAAHGKFTVAVVGGGPSSVEIAGNVWRLLKDCARHMADIRIFAGRKLMSRFPASIRQKAMKSLQKRGIEIFETGYVKEVEAGKLTLESGEQFAADFIFLSLGVKPSEIFRNSGLPTGPDGGLLVNRYLQSTGFPEIFGGGDCIYFYEQPLDKVGVYAVRENPVLYHNLMASLEGEQLQAFSPGGDYLLIFNLGTGIFRKKWLEFDGRLAFLIKDYIDRKFMKKFQSIE